MCIYLSIIFKLRKHSHARTQDNSKEKERKLMFFQKLCFNEFFMFIFISIFNQTIPKTVCYEKCFSFAFAFEREFMSWYKSSWKTNCNWNLSVEKYLGWSINYIFCLNIHRTFLNLFRCMQPIFPRMSLLRISIFFLL